jgi:hypothetical protein
VLGSDLAVYVNNCVVEHILQSTAFLEDDLVNSLALTTDDTLFKDSPLKAVAFCGEFVMFADPARLSISWDPLRPAGKVLH